MAENWAAHQLRSIYVSASLPMIVLSILKERPQNCLGVMDTIFRRFGTAPALREFHNVIEDLVRQGCAGPVSGHGHAQLRITRRGVAVLSEMSRMNTAIAVAIAT